MKQYATLWIKDNIYRLFDEHGATLLRGETIEEIDYVWQKPQVFNLLSEKRWSFEANTSVESWYLMSKEV